MTGVGELIWDFFIPREHIRLWHDPQGRMVAYAILGEDPPFNCQVLPGHEWRGFEAQALEALLISG